MDISLDESLFNEIIKRSLSKRDYKVEKIVKQINYYRKKFEESKALFVN